MTELNRFLRHGFSPMVVYLVAEGYLPEYMQHDVTEMLVIGGSFAVPVAWSKLREAIK